MKNLLDEVLACRYCEAMLPLGPKPILSISPVSSILIIGQAPGTKVHASGVPWDDMSGRELRRWLGVTSDEFYDTDLFGIVPMGLCYPGRGRGGDLPPRPECAPLWHSRLLATMPEVKMTLLIGAYAQNYYLGKRKQKTLTESVRNYQDYLPNYFPLVHPSPRNKIWQKRNPWFEHEIIPELQGRVRQVLNKKL